MVFTRAMKYVLGIALVGVGLALVVLCLTLRVQFNTIARQADAPNFDDYPLLQVFVPTQEPSAAHPQPNELAQNIMLRINVVGALGLMLVVLGLCVCVVGRHNQPTHDDSARRGDQRIS